MGKLGGQRKGGGREGEWWAPGLALLVPACSRLGKLGGQRKGRGREGEWRAPGLAPWLAEACSRLGKLGEQRKGGEERGNGGRRGLHRLRRHARAIRVSWGRWPWIGEGIESGVGPGLWVAFRH